ncbi:MAG TPA: lysophospholipid acyltransferase family protein [Terriglobales bacterium]|nr:lysophospholipid acyltransferase family protein [Terriglobales bacterium]
MARIAATGLWGHRTLPHNASRYQAAEWLHQSCARARRALNVQLEIEGQLPTEGLVVSNHVSYLDIVVFSAVLPCVFISKAEVERWPVIGRYARWAGTVFVRRHDRGDAARANVSVEDALREAVPVVLFPEGTTTDSRRILRFHSTMLQPAIDASAPVTPCAIDYQLDDGDPDREVCWWGDMTLLPHMWNLLGKKTIRTRIVFGRAMAARGHRKELSGILHEEVKRLHAGAKGPYASQPRAVAT